LALYKTTDYFEIKPLQEILCHFYCKTTLAFNDTKFINEAQKFDSDGLLKLALDQFAHGMHMAEYIQEDQLEPSFLLQALELQ
jgi:hypothetical protein